MIRCAALITSVGIVLAIGAGGCDDAERERRAREAAEQMKESIPDVHARALEQAATPEEIELAQRALTVEKEYMGPIDGKLDRVTVNAIQAFQRRHDLADNGILAGRTFELLRAVVD